MLDDENVDNDVTIEDENSESELSKDDFVDDNHVWVDETPISHVWIDETPIGDVSSDTDSGNDVVRRYLRTVFVVLIVAFICLQSKWDFGFDVWLTYFIILLAPAITIFVTILFFIFDRLFKRD